MGADDLEFWRMKRVLEITGLSKSEIYRRMRDVQPSLNPFPASYRYRSGIQQTFWRSDEVRAWQARESGPIDVWSLIG